MTTKNTILFALITVGLLAMSTALAQWTPPPGTPPACPSTEPGCNLPLNISSEPQMKSGTLGSFTGLLAGSSTDTILRAYNSGGATFTPRVGIGTFTPQNTLHVAGGVRITGGTPGIDKVLTSTNTSGDATWKSLSEIIGSLGVSKIFPGTNVTITKPDGTASDGTGEVKINATGGSGGGSNWSVFGSSVYRPSGNVGIGTSSPVTQLHTTDTVRFAGLGSTDSGNNIVTIDGYGNLKYRIANSSWPCGGSSGGVTKITAGSGISVTPTDGTGNVTITSTSTGGGSSGGVTKIKAGNNVTISPADGTGDVTINTTGGSGGMSNPMTAQGDMIYANNSSGNPARLAGGTGFLKSTSVTDAPTWSALSATDITSGTFAAARIPKPSPTVTTRREMGTASALSASATPSNLEIRASCNAGEVLVGGGGRCGSYYTPTGPGTFQVFGHLVSSRPYPASSETTTNNEWYVACPRQIDYIAGSHSVYTIQGFAYAQCLSF